MMIDYIASIYSFVHAFVKMRCLKTSVLLLLLLAPLAANALHIERVNEIPRYDVNCAYEDRMGFIWVATLDGLFRYDGHESRVYLPSESEGSISSTMIHVINEDLRGNIWMGTYGQGISMLDPRTGRFRNYSLSDIFGDEDQYNDIISIEIDRQNNIWIGTVRNFGRLELDDQSLDIVEFHDYSQSILESDDDPMTAITTIFEDRAGNLWVGSSSGVHRIVEERDGELITEWFWLSCNDICDYNANSILVSGERITPIELDMESGKYCIGESLPQRHSVSILYNQGTIWSGNRMGLRQIRKDDNGEWTVINTLTQSRYKGVSDIVTSLMVNNRTKYGFYRGGSLHRWRGRGVSQLP